MGTQPDTEVTKTGGSAMTARRNRPRVAGERAAERRRLAHQPPTPPPPPPHRRTALPKPRLPRPRLARPRLPRIEALTAVLVVLVLLSAAGVAFLAVALHRAQAAESAATDAQVTAARYAEQLLSYDYAHLDRDFSAARSLLTDDFVKEYTDATRVVRAQAVEDRAVIKAETVASSVVSAEPDEVRTLLFVNQTTTTGAQGASPSLDLNRVMLTLVEEDGRWLVSDLDAM
jgi:Mce-associated membrane protein